MKISKITVENYRLLKNFSLDLEEELSLVIGKNNTGKTSILSILDKFLNSTDKHGITFDDFNIDFKKKVKSLVETLAVTPEDSFEDFAIKLKIFIEYKDSDNLSNLGRVFMSLEPDNNIVVLGFEYMLKYEDYIDLKRDYQAFEIKEKAKAKDKKGYQPKTLFDFLKKNHSNYFKVSKKTFEVEKSTGKVNEKVFVDLVKEGISTKEIINFKYISARRGVSNSKFDKSLSSQTSKIYEKKEADEDQNVVIEGFKDKLSEVDTELSQVYKGLFSSAIEKVRKFGGVTLNDSEIEIISTLQHKELLEGNTTVIYRHDTDHQLPEHYNGLGYMNLISMIFEIEILLQDFKKEKEVTPSDINLLFIEEPEAHTHPQMQYIFIKNIKQLLKEGVARADGQNRKLQYIVSTHSSHIVADSDFDDIKYLKKEAINSVGAKNLKDLKATYEIEGKQYQFLKQYLTISRAEVFFAEKVILIEGDTERILIPTIMKKLDIEEEKKPEGLPLLSQNISIIETGAHSQVFEQFIDFLGIKTLIITDIDTVKEEVNLDGKLIKDACEVSLGTDYSNSALRHFFTKKVEGMAPAIATLEELKKYSIDDKVFPKSNSKVCIVYQTEEEGYHARSFEDAFLNINREFVAKNKDTFEGLKNRSYFDNAKNNPYYLANQCINKKTHFALDILFHSNEKFNNWKIPAYIREGILWLKQD